MDGRAWNSGYEVTVDNWRSFQWVKSIREVTQMFNENGVKVSASTVHAIQAQCDDRARERAVMVGSGVGILKWCIHTLLTLTRGHSTTVRDVTGNPCERSTWSLYSLYSLDALTLTPSSRSTGTACDRLENMYTVPSITTHQCALPSPHRLLIYTPRPCIPGTRP